MVEVVLDVVELAVLDEELDVVVLELGVVELVELDVEEELLGVVPPATVHSENVAV